MPFAVELLLDGRAREAVRGVWEALRDAGVSTSMLDTGSRPHVTLAVYEDLELPPFKRQAEAFFASETAIDVPLSGVGTFQSEEGVVYLAPVVTPELLGLHQRFHRRFDHLAAGAWAYYRPGVWVPHCTLALHVADEDRGRAFEIALAGGLPTRARLRTACVERFTQGDPGPVEQCFEAEFGV
jgi:2'-5' RNA ligase